MQFYNDFKGETMFSKAIERGDANTIIEAEKNLVKMSPDRLADA